MMKRSVILLLGSALLFIFTGFMQHATGRKITLYHNPAAGQKMLQESPDEPNPEPAPEPPAPEPAPEPPGPEPPQDTSV
jgi:hypothetical protein